MKIQLHNWWELKKRLQKRYSHLSEEDLTYEYGKEQELIVRLQKKTGTSHEDMVRIIKSFQVAYLHQELL